MIYQDRIYGEIEIKEPVILELIESKPLQRLKGIAQYGIPDDFYHVPGYSRFEHSIGTMSLLEKIKGGLEEQVAGLLHDVSHTAFSHLFDWIGGESENEDHQDKTHKDFILKSDIAQILKKHNLDPLRISEVKNFGLLEREIPDLCADRMDYTFRDYFWENPPAVQDYLNKLINFNDSIVFTDFKIAEDFARNYLKCQTEHWGGYEAVGRYYYFSYLFQMALDKKILFLDDFYQDDNFIIKKIYDSKNNDLIDILEELKKKPLEKLNLGEKKILKKKFRYVDPKILENGKIFILSSVSPEFKNFLEDQKITNSQGIEF